MSKTKDKMTFVEAINRYVHRYTIDHVPEWAKHKAPKWQVLCTSVSK